MMLVGRLLWVLFAFLVASTAAGLVVTLGLLLPALDDAGSATATPDAVEWIVGISTALIGAEALIPAMLLIALAEGFRLRSFVFYALAGAAIAWYCGWMSGFEGDLGLNHAGEVLAASGIAAGLIYWVLAGRRAGAWREADPRGRHETQAERL
jgi:hypothetical protein